MRLLLVEDDDHVAAALSAVLARHGLTVVHARSGGEALQALLPDDAEPFAVVLLDLGLPDQDGFEVCGRIRKVSATPVIMVTARADVRSRIHGLNLGADDYVVKPYDTGELLARIHAVSRRTATGAPAGPAGGTEQPPDDGGPREPLRLGPLAIELPTRQVVVDGAAVPLTRKEFDLLALLAQRPGVVFRREQIISEVWRTSWEGTGRTLEVHIASLRAKLRMPALIETVRGVGYRLVVPAAGPAAGARPAAP
ncbi:response regulator transcription factor [Streptomyces sp. RS10V-4]|uniref:response regulator transcription factor n=1 Tax=Streptomyces rhizoryzae TaxID=2932493 RepID=UPI00200466A7|nr:response regulator transcription factor [Streptomyces rhizoryzae]MCK7626135.1 response regulator transcription factor [Streptomyces rhizoryzae]